MTIATVPLATKIADEGFACCCTELAIGAAAARDEEEPGAEVPMTS